MKKVFLGIILISSIFAISAAIEDSSDRDAELNNRLQFFFQKINWMSNRINNLKALSNQTDSTYRDYIATIKQYLSILPGDYSRLKFQIDRTKKLEKPNEFDIGFVNSDRIKKILDDLLSNEPTFMDGASYSQIKPELEKLRENYQDILDTFQSKYNISL